MTISHAKVTEEGRLQAEESYRRFLSDVKSTKLPWLIALGQSPGASVTSAVVFREFEKLLPRLKGTIVLKKALPAQISFVYIKFNVTEPSILLIRPDGSHKLRQIDPDDPLALVGPMVYAAQKCLAMPWHKRIKSFVVFLFSTLRNIATRKSLLVSPEEVEARLGICRGCSFFDAKKVKCNSCGCPLATKSKFKEATCPESKWPQ